jgi:hypothetical protein
MAKKVQENNPELLRPWNESKQDIKNSVSQKVLNSKLPKNNQVHYMQTLPIEQPRKPNKN